LVSRCPAAFSKGTLQEHVAQVGQALTDEHSADSEFRSTWRCQWSRPSPRDLQ
jgi:hypothetical protein